MYSVNYLMLFDKAVRLRAFRVAGSELRNRWRLRRVISPTSGSGSSLNSTVNNDIIRVITGEFPFSQDLLYVGQLFSL